ncbi:MAG: hypothetical protein F7B20_07020 [Aeropyrum sp.]|nr:hypothetical protein [Aeropyrum sp.]MCE4615751.1 hypothetical protein [Aeropyrum sp.]
MMSSGKTTFIEDKLSEAVSYLLGQGVDDSSNAMCTERKPGYNSCSKPSRT